MTEITTPVYLYSSSGEVLDISLPDENDAFSFKELPYGTYILEIESLNLSPYKINVTLSPEAPEVSNVVFDLNNPVSVKDINKSTKLMVRSINENNIVVQINEGGEYSLTITSLSGKTLFNSEIYIEANVENIIPVGPISGGIYILKLQNSKNIEVVKFLK